jgi:hypothetical protein
MVSRGYFIIGNEGVTFYEDTHIAERCQGKGFTNLLFDLLSYLLLTLVDDLRREV